MYMDIPGLTSSSAGTTHIFALRRNHAPFAFFSLRSASHAAWYSS